MTTPYDRKILLVNWLGRTSPGNSIADVAKLIRNKMPNVAGVILKTSNGVSWQGRLGDSGPLAVNGVRRIQQWVEEFDKQGLEVHVWGVPRAKRPVGASESPDIQKEAKKFIRAASVVGVKSLLLDVEHGQYYWQGSPAEAQALMNRIRDRVPGDTHIGMVLDGRHNRDFSFWVDPWITHVDSLHPMVYPILFGRHKTIEQHLDEAFRNLEVYDKPIVPMLQAFGEADRRPTPGEITRQGNAAWARGAVGISFFRLGSDIWPRDQQPQMGEPEYAAIARIKIPTVPAKPIVPTYTWQDVINAAVTVATSVGESWQQWFTAAGVWGSFNESLRSEPYSGPPIEHWPISPNLRQRILALLQPKDRKYGAAIGIHGAPGVAAPPPDKWDTWIGYLKDMGIKWYKQCDNGDPGDLGPHSIFAWAKRLKQEGIEPIIRYLVSEQFPDSLPSRFFDKMQHYADAEIFWAEIGNEPNLDHEWKSAWHNREGHYPMCYSNPDVIRHIAETWIKDAKLALDAGVRPAFYAFAPTDWSGKYNPLYSSVFFTQNVVLYLAQHHRAETIDIFQRGGWIAVHAATYEKANDFDPFGQSPVWDMTLRSYEVVLRAFRDYFGADLDVDAIDVISTEGGVFTPDSTPNIEHNVLITDEEHAQRVVEMFKWLEQYSPLKAMCAWCISVGSQIGHFDGQFQHDGWIEELNGVLCPHAVVPAMEQLRFENERAEEQERDPSQVIKLDVPYISQFDPTANTHSADCGPTCMAMLINAGKPLAQHVTVDELYARHLPNKPVGGYTSIGEMLNIGNAEGLSVQRFNYGNGNNAFEKLQTLINNQTPFVALVNYDKWEDIAHNNFRGGHFVVVTGCDQNNVFVHDPLFRGIRRDEGQFFIWRNQTFLDGWGSGHEIGNPDFAVIVPNKKVARL